MHHQGLYSETIKLGLFNSDEHDRFQYRREYGTIHDQIPA